VSASPVKNGFCIVADDQKAFYAATLNAGSVKLVGGPFSGGGTWISSDGMYAVVRNSNSGMIGVIDREGRNVVAPEYTLWSIVSPSIIFLAKDGDRTWHQFSGKLQKTNVDVGMAVYDLGFKEVYLFETFSHVGYVNSDWKVIVRVKKAKEYHPPVIR
jgi:hypothetical protein